MFLIGGEKKKGWESAVNLTTAKLILDELSTKEQSRAEQRCQRQVIGKRQTLDDRSDQRRETVMKKCSRDLDR